jgi:hypothetical protein
MHSHWLASIPRGVYDDLAEGYDGVGGGVPGGGMGWVVALLLLVALVLLGVVVQAVREGARMKVRGEATPLPPLPVSRIHGALVDDSHKDIEKENLL